MTGLVLMALLAAHPGCVVHRNDHGRIVRKRNVLAEFKKAHPCPGGPDQGSVHHCRGYVIDHVCPLACCGTDGMPNLQWQTVAEGKAKDRWELKCERSCALTGADSESKR